MIRWLAVALLCGGCQSAGPLKALPFPEWPDLHWAKSGAWCLDQADAQDLDKFFDKLKAYKAATERLDR
jgi:hypothetical protein